MRHLTLALCCVSLLVTQARGEDASTRVQPVAASVQREPINTVVPIFRAFVNVGTDKFTFLIPETFRMGGDASLGKLTLSSVESDTLITLNFMGPPTGDGKDATISTWREMLAKRYAEGRFGQQFSRPVVGHSATGVDVEWKGPAGLAQTTRAIFVPTAAGPLELTVTAGTKKFHEAQITFSEFLGSLTASVDGKLTIHRLADKM